MLKIRLERVGKKHQPSYRLVLVDSRRAAKSGSFKEILGFYNVLKKQIQFNGERIKEWMKKGAQVSDTVHNLLIKEKIIDEKKRMIKIKKRKTAEPKKVEAEAELKDNNVKSENV